MERGGRGVLGGVMGSGDEQACLGHDGCQAKCLERCGLTTCTGQHCQQMLACNSRTYLLDNSRALWSVMESSQGWSRDP